MRASEKAAQLIDEIKAAVGIKDDDGWQAYWDEDAERLNKMAEAAKKFAVKIPESRAFCPTGEGGGIDNSCGSGDKGQKMAPDKDSGGGGGDEDLPGDGDNFDAVANEILRSIEATGGYSVHPITAESPTTGYMVATVPQAEEKIQGLENVTGDRIREYFGKHADYLSKNPKLHLGGWFNLDDGLVYLDLSERFEDIDEAIDKAVEKSQLAIWDLNTKTEIKKEDYDARRTRKKEPRSVRLPAGRGPGRDSGGDPKGRIQAPGREGGEGEGGEEVERREDCGRVDGGKFGPGNDCQAEGESGSAERIDHDQILPATKSGWRSADGVANWQADKLQSKSSPAKSASNAASLSIFGGKSTSESLDNIGLSLDEVIRATSVPDEYTHVVVSAGDAAHLKDLLGRQTSTVGNTDEVAVASLITGEDGGIVATTMASVRRHDGGDLELNYTLFAVNEEAKEKSSFAIARKLMEAIPKSISEAEKIGIDRVTLKAAGDAEDETFQGYRIWPRMGFDGTIPRNLVTNKYTLTKGVFNSYGDRIPNSILSPRAREEKARGQLTIQALYETKEGQRWWDRNGGQMTLSLELKSPDSPGMVAFKKVREKVGVRSFADFLLSESRELDLVWAEIRTEARAWCPTGEGGGQDNSCSSSEGSGADAALEAIASAQKTASPEGPRIWTPGQPTGLVTSRAAASPPTVRSEDGKKIVSTEIPDAHVYPFAGREWVSTIDAGAYLSSLQGEFRGGVINTATGRGELAQEDFEYIAAALSDQAADATRRGIAPLFYSPEELNRQLDEFAALVPQVRGGRTKDGTLIEQEDAEHLFRVLQALTSPNASPFSNMQRTDSLLRKFFDGDGRVTTGDTLGVTGVGIRKSLQRFQRIVDTLGKRTDGSIDTAAGLKAARELMLHKMIPSGEVQAFFADFASPGDSKDAWKSSQYRVSEMVPVFSTFGPKVGPFYENNQGNHDPLTADVWFTRTWGRITGELVVPGKPEKAVEHAKKLIGAFKGATEEHYHGIPPSDLHDAIRRTTESGVVDDVLRVWSADRLRHFAAGDYKEKSGVGGRLNRLAKNIVENDTSLMGQPGAGSRRSSMIRAMKEAASRTGMPVAYLQDVLWQDEQDAYAALGAKTATDVGELSLYSDQIRRIAQDQKNNRRPMARKDRSDRRSYGPADEFYDDYERGGREQMLWDAALANVDDQEFADAVIALANGVRKTAARAYCPTGEGNGIDNSCSPSAALPKGQDAPAESSVKFGDKQEEIDSRLESLGVDMGSALAMAGGGKDGVYTFIRRDNEKPSEGGLHIENTRDVAGVKDGMFSTTVIRNAGAESDPEIIVDHKLMDVLPAVAASPEKRHAAAREFLRTMTESVESAVKSGASKVVLNAAGNARGRTSFRGYTIWPRMGFDAPLPFDLRNKLPKELDHCRTLLDLHATPEGTRWWKKNGTDIDVQMDLTRPDSPQMQVFGRFVRHFERDRRELAFGTGDGWLSPADEAKLDSLWKKLWDDGLLDDYDSEVEGRAFCATGEGGGVKNTCSSADGGVDDSWEESDEAVEVWEKEDLKDRSPLQDGGKLQSFAIESPTETKAALDTLGVSLSDAVTMCAAPSEGTTVVVSPEHPYDTMGLGDFGESSKALIFTMTTKDVAGIKDALDSNASIRRTKDDELILEYHAFHASAKAQKEAAVACAKEVIGGVIQSISVAEKSGVSEIRLDAAGSKDHESFKGYRIWPKFGFDGVIPRKMLTRLREQDLSPRALAEKRAGKLTVQALYETKSGQQFWEEKGSEIPMFLRPGDDSTPGWGRFKAYRQRVGKLSESRDFSASDEIFSEEEIKKLDELWDEFRKEAAEHRAFCATGEGGGIDNSCGSSGGPRVMMAPDKDSGGGWGGETQDWGKSSDTETFTSRSPLFPGAENLASIRIYRPNDVKGIVEDELKMQISDAVLASGPVIESAKRAGITMPRLEITPGQYGGIDMHWSAMGVSTGEGFRGEEAQFAPTPGTAVKAAEASRAVSKGKGGLILKMNGFFVHPDFQGKGIALDSVVHSVASGAARLEMDAERFDHPNPNTRMTGYSVWPRFGYDAPMSEVVRVLGQRGVTLPAEYEKARSLTGIYALPGGADFWRQNGGPIRLTFDTRPRSVNQQILLQCVDRKRKLEGRSMANDLGGNPVGIDSDFDPVLDEVWSDIVSGKIELTGTVPTQEEWDEWESERQRGATDGDAGEVQAH